MNTFTSRDLKAGAFPQVGVDPLDVQPVDREPALVPPVACKRGCDKACGYQCRGPRGTAAATSMTCARRSPGWRGRPCQPRQGRRLEAARAAPAPGRPGRPRPGCRRTGRIVGILRAGVL